jgi:hypothetical protein
MANEETQALADEEALFSLKPHEVSDELRPRIDELELWDVVDGLRENGYAVIHDAAPPSLVDDLREAIHSFALDREGSIVAGAPLLLGRHPAVDLVATLPKVMAIAEYSVGKAMRAGRIVGSVKPEGGEGLGLHADQNWMPTPFPEHNLMVTFCVACEGMTEAGGSTFVAPGSHRLRRMPTEKEMANTPVVPIEAKKGDIAVWDGMAWHGAYDRKIPGIRTVLHATYQRLYTQPIDDFTYLLKDEEYMANAPEGIRQLLGADLFFHTATTEHDVDMAKFGYAMEAAKL